MAGFGRDKSVDSGGFRGIIPDNTIVPVIVIEGDASLVKMKNGKNAGKTARIFKPVFEVIFAKYSGGRIYGDVWCNVEPDPAGGEPHVFGSHMTFCDLCDISDVHEDDGTFPIANDEAEAKALSQRFIGKMMLLTVGVQDYPKRDGSTGTKNTVKGLNPMNEEQVTQMTEHGASTMEKIAKQAAARAAREGGSGLEEEDDNDDTPF